MAGGAPVPPPRALGPGHTVLALPRVGLGYQKLLVCGCPSTRAAERRPGGREARKLGICLSLQRPDGLYSWGLPESLQGWPLLLGQVSAHMSSTQRAALTRSDPGPASPSLSPSPPGLSLHCPQPVFIAAPSPLPWGRSSLFFLSACRTVLSTFLAHTEERGDKGKFLMDNDSSPQDRSSSFTLRPVGPFP